MTCGGGRFFLLAIEWGLHLIWKKASISLFPPLLRIASSSRRPVFVNPHADVSVFTAMYTCTVRGHLPGGGARLVSASFLSDTHGMCGSWIRRPCWYEVITP